MTSGIPQDPRSVCSHVPYGEVQDWSGIDAQMISSASFNIRCAPALIKL